MILRARIVVPIVGPPISDGAILVKGSRIYSVGRWADLPSHHKAEVIDLGEVILLPGLINAHCHLDYTQMAGQFPSPKLFTDWLKVITSTKAGWTAADYAASWLSGARMLLRSGSTTVADIEAVPQLLPDVWNLTPLRIISFLEMIGITNRRTPEAILDETLNTIATLTHKRCVLGVSPHAPYSATPSLLRLTAEAARQRSCLVCTHVAESATEYEMFVNAKGEMFDWLRRSGREMSDCGLGSPVRHLQRCGMLGNTLLATHANYLAKGDAGLLARRKVSVVHCPRSHVFFRHEPFPLRRLLGAGVNVCLGTDSLASVIKPSRQLIELDMFAEMRQLADRHPYLSASAILRMATLNGARALGQRGAVGELSPNALADLIALPYKGKLAKAPDAIIEHRGPVPASMIDGQWALPPG